MAHDTLHHHDHSHHNSDDLADLLDLDAEVLHAYHTEVFDWVHDGAAGSRRVVDLGSGTGTGALALAGRFEGADVTALDMSAAMLDRLRQRATERGLGDRIRTTVTDLDHGWPPMEPVDLIWAANSLHHMADPHRVLTEIRTALRPGGVLALAEMDTYPRFLPESLGDGLEERCLAAAAGAVAHELPHLGSDWRSRLIEAGFEIAAERRFVIDLAPPLPVAAGRYAQASLQRMRSGLDGHLSAEDLARLDDLLADNAIASRTDLNIRATRTVWQAHS